MSTPTNFSLTFEPTLATATVTDATVMSAYLTKNVSTNYDTMKNACVYYYTFTDKMTELKFREFFGTTATRASYLNSIALRLDKTNAGQSVLAKYNSDNGWTNLPDKKEFIDYTINFTSGGNNFDSILNSIGIAATEWSSGGKFQLIFRFKVGTGGVSDPVKDYTVGVEWTMSN